MTDSQTILTQIRAANPTLQFARTESEIGVWSETDGRFIPCVALTLPGEWVKVPFEILVNGQRIERNWTEE